MIPMNRKDATILANPFFLYGFTWLGVVGLYLLPWSNLLPNLKLNLLVFLLLSSLFSFGLGSLLHLKKVVLYTSLDCTPKMVRRIIYSLAVLYLLLIVEFMEGGVPFYSYLFTAADAGVYKHFGIPFIHVLVLNGFGFLFLFSGHLLISSQSRKLKMHLRIVMSLCLLAGVLMFNRALIMYSAFGFAIIFLMSKARVVRLLLLVIVFFLALLYLFGLMGSYRSGAGYKFGQEYALNLADATDEFRQTGIPAEFLWAYVYITSPLGNLQNTIDKSNTESVNYRRFPELLSRLMPEMISKRVGLEAPEGKRIAPYLTVGTVYMRSYAALGWPGMILTFVFFVFFVFLFFKLVPASSVYFVSGLTVVNLIVFFNLFDNMFFSMSILPQLAFPILLQCWEQLAFIIRKDR